MPNLGTRLLVGTMLLCVAVSGLTNGSAQARPDFSGRWTSDPDPAAVPAGARGATGARQGGRGGGRGDMGSGWGASITITQDAARLIVEYAFFSRGDLQPPLRFVYALNGSPSTNTVMMGRGTQAQISRATWDAEKLIISTTHTLTDPATGKPVAVDVKQLLWLEGPASLVVETVRAGVLGGPASTTRTVYRRL